MKQIPLTQNKFAIVDDDDYPELSKHKWHALYMSGNPYAYRRKKITGERVSMHREIAKPPKGLVTDHINGDTLDNRKSNLRNCTAKQNGFNQRKAITNKSGFKGVRWAKWAGKWQAHISPGKKFTYLGYFDTAEDAARAYDKKAREVYGEFAKTNF